MDWESTDPQSRVDRRRRTLETRDATGSQPTRGSPPPPPPALSTCLPMSALDPKAGELEHLGPSAGHRGLRPQVQKESPFLCGQEARPVHHIPPSSPVPGSPPHIARPFQQPAASIPSPHSPLQNISLGEMSILFLCLISGSVVYLLSCKSSFMKG